MADLKIRAGDYGFDIQFTVQKSDGSVYSLVNYTIKLKVWLEGASKRLMVDGTCTPVDAAAGTCKYTVASGDFSVPGEYKGELELTKAGVVESTVTFDIEVEESG